MRMCHLATHLDDRGQSVEVVVAIDNLLAFRHTSDDHLEVSGVAVSPEQVGCCDTFPGNIHHHILPYHTQTLTNLGIEWNVISDWPHNSKLDG